MNLPLRVLPALLLAGGLALAGAARATYVFNTVDYPGAVMTDVRAVNNAGEIAGYASFDGLTHFSFTYAAGVFTPLPVSPPSACRRWA